MTSWIIAWDNLRFNKMRTVMAILVIALASSALLILRGYVNYSSEGMKLNFISQNGAFQIAHKDFWNVATEDKPFLKGDDYHLLSGILDAAYGISDYQQLISINGIVGTTQKSKIFSGDTFETLSPAFYQRINGGSNFIESGLVLGKDLAEYLGVHPNKNSIVTLMSSGQSGIALISLPVMGTIDVGSRDANALLAFMTLHDARSFYGMTEEFDRMRVDVADINDIPKIKQNLLIALEGTPLELKDWMDLSPNYKDINAYNEQASFFATFILALFIFTSIMQILHMSFWQRMGELGTLRAIGLTPKRVFGLLLRETTLLALTGVLSGTLFVLCLASYTKGSPIPFRPPMSSETYPMVLLIYLSDLLVVNGMIFATVLCSGLYPAYKAISRPVVEVMRHV